MKDSGKIFIILALALAMCFFGPYLEQLIWNKVIVELFNAPEVTYWQMFLLDVFCSCLFPAKYSNRGNKNV